MSELLEDYHEAKKMVDEYIVDIISPNCIVILVDKVGDDYSSIYGGVKKQVVRGPDGKPVQIVVPEYAKNRHQTGVGVATILKKWTPDEEDMGEYDKRSLLLKEGDRIVFNPGTPISQSVFANHRIQILHLNNVLFKSHPILDQNHGSLLERTA